MKYEDYRLLDYILSARKPVSAQEILTYLSHEIEGFAERQPESGGLRNVQGRLQKLVDCEHFSKLIEVTKDGRKNLYSAVSKAPKAAASMSIEQACALLMSDKHLSAIAPTRLFQSQSEFQELIARAEAEVKKHQHLHRLQNNTDISDFLKRVTVVQRGQRLLGAKVSNKTLECIANCILQNRCISLKYKSKTEPRVLHPFGLVFRQPKVYLLAVDEVEMKAKGPSRVRPRLFLCNRIRNAKISGLAHEVPKGFDVDTYVARGRLDMLTNTTKDTVENTGKMVGEKNSGSRSFTLKLRLVNEPMDNLITDLREFPLSDTQNISAEKGTGDYVLTATGMYTTHSLVEWIMGRMDRVEVLAPRSFRSYVKGKVAAMHQAYQS